MLDATNSASTLAGHATTLVEGALYALGGMIPLDGRVSWVPAEATGFQPVNCYVLREGATSLLVDTGVAHNEALVLAQLRQVVPDDGELTIFLTRGEMDCVSNLGAVSAQYRISDLFTGGVTNPFDAFDDVRALAQRERRRQVEQKGLGGSSMARTPVIELGNGRTLEIESPTLRLLPTFWAWDHRTKALFTSDTFTHGTCSTSQGSCVIDDALAEPGTRQEVAAHLHAKYEWIPRANRRAIRDYVRETFERREPEIVAPTRGRILRGRDVVERHLGLMLDVLAD